MSHLYHVYSIAYRKPCPDSPTSKLVDHQGLFLAPAHLSNTSGRVYFLEYTGQPADGTNYNDNVSFRLPNRKLPSWEQPKRDCSAFGFNTPIDETQSALYFSTYFPVYDFKLLGLCQDVNGLCKTAKTVARFNHGLSAQGNLNWMNDVLASAVSQKIYQTVIEHEREKRERERLKQRSPSRLQKSSSSSLNKNLLDAKSKLQLLFYDSL